MDFLKIMFREFYNKSLLINHYFLKILSSIILPKFWILREASHYPALMDNRRCSHMPLTYPSSEWYITCTILVIGAYSEPHQISKIELFSRIVDLFQPLTILAKDSISDVRLGSVYVSALYVCLCRLGREWVFLLWPDAKSWGECLTTKWEGNYQTIKLYNLGLILEWVDVM